MPHTLPGVCLTPPLPVGFDASGLVRTQHSRSSSPIDQMNGAVAAVTKLAGQLASTWSEDLAMVLTSGVVSAAEEFFREIIVQSIVICPVCRAQVAALPTTIGAALSGSESDALHTSLEAVSLSSGKNLRATSKQYLGFSWDTESSLGAAVDLYDVVCTLRHCAVHSGGLVNRRNAATLGVAAQSRVAISTPADLLALAHVVLSTARLFNAELFRHIVTRWIDRGHLVGSWSADGDAMRRLWSSFVSTSDRPAAAHSGTPISSSAYSAWRSIRPIVLAARTAAV